jgi:hypothetical protein
MLNYATSSTFKVPSTSTPKKFPEKDKLSEKGLFFTDLLWVNFEGTRKVTAFYTEEIKKSREAYFKTPEGKALVNWRTTQSDTLEIDILLDLTDVMAGFNLEDQGTCSRIEAESMAMKNWVEGKTTFTLYHSATREWKKGTVN